MICCFWIVLFGSHFGYFLSQKCCMHVGTEAIRISNWNLSEWHIRANAHKVTPLSLVYTRNRSTQKYMHAKGERDTWVSE